MLPNLLATRIGRLVAFTLLYVTEGVPYAFVAIAMTTQMKRQSFSVTDIGYFSAAIFIPWGFKWLAGPFVDVIYSRRLGQRRGWILCMQVLMVLSLMAVKAVGFSVGLTTLVALVVLHNVFAAVQDVAIDALAVQTLHTDERGLANGLMFGGSFIGQALGGGVALMLTARFGFDAAFYFVIAVIALVWLFVVLPMREVALPVRAVSATGRRQKIQQDIVSFVREAWQAFTAERAAWLALVLALLPIGAMSMSTAMTNNIAVELGLNDGRIGQLQVWTTVIGAVASAFGGWMADRHGRRLQIGLGVVLVALPTLYMAWKLQTAGILLPNAGGARAGISPELVSQFWWTNMIYAVFFGYIYGSKFALFMDVTRPAVAATQFTAYMAIANLTLSYTSALQGRLAGSYGYPTVLVVDALLGMVCLLLLPLMRTRAGK